MSHFFYYLCSLFFSERYPAGLKQNVSMSLYTFKQ